MQVWEASFRTFGPLVTSLNDVAFGDYQLLDTESRMLPGFNPIQ
jgi:hypothetical protein